MAKTREPSQSVQNTPNFANRTLYHGDNLEFLRGMNDECIDLIATDPPFNTRRNRSSSASAYEDKWQWLDEGEVLPDQWAWENVVHTHWLEEVKDVNEALWDVIETTKRTHSLGTAAFLCFLGVRLLEMHRVLKPNGSLFLHCDDTANGYIRLALDAIFGQQNFLNEIVWKRTSGRSDANHFGRVHDTIFYYSKSSDRTWNPFVVPNSLEHINKNYRNKDHLGRWSSGDLTASGTSGGESGKPWRGRDPNKNDNHWRTPTKGGMNDFIRKHNLIPGWPDAFPSVHQRLDALDEAGLVHWPKNGLGMPRLKRYLDSTDGIHIEDVVSDISNVQGASAENANAPDQKPLELYRRLILVSTNPGDWVLDPFCGCATTPIAAEELGRKWVGIDRRSDAEVHVLNRLLTASNRTTTKQFIEIDRDTGIVDHGRLEKARKLVAGMGFTFSSQPPIPTNKDVEVPYLKQVAGRPIRRRNRFTYAEMKDILIKVFDAVCWGCGYRPEATPLHPAEAFLELDHINPVSGGGDNGITNRALLCRPCNGFKSDSKTLVEVQRQAGFRTGNRKRGSTPPIDIQLAPLKLEAFLADLPLKSTLAKSA